LQRLSAWWVEEGRNWREYGVEAAEVHGAELIAKLVGVADRGSATLLQGKNVAVPRAALPEPGEDEFYCADLIGLTVVNLRGEPMGRVEDVVETGANAVLVVRGERERLIPFTAEVVAKVDLAASALAVEWELDY
jgi:16S rRNA processing protein RimM